ncbi:Gfo/Idh/MocA family oxidoreductase [Cryobacterium sp. Hh7]|uniref:Gfo/Idh/MocA family protein n=1 Tax=Cryobacterium sp. Hh7 TaxID=1259159 RepID=UPI001069FD7F|nr:Gfo/Idh/MocA family oxidoreductase [Cryobacterium sp. Hh7]TFD52672.1 Gfo/Idh/MocA family oxidoreductase [Cryobacterium sp. Hh7]
MNARTVNIGIVGAGLMGREIAMAIQRWPALIDHPVRAQVTAVCDINPAAMEWFDQIPTVITKVTNYSELLADPAIDVVYIAVRHDLHEQMYIDAIAAGKDLLAEKPFGIDRAAAENIVEATRAHPDSFVRCSSEMPFFPGAQQAINAIRSGSLGRIIEVRSSFLHSSDLDLQKGINWKRQTAYCGKAGVMNDLGLHALHVPLRLGWNPQSVFSTLQNLVPTRPGPDGAPEACDTFENAVLTTNVLLEDGEQFPLTIETKRISPGDKNTWELRAVGLDGGVFFSTKNPKRVSTFAVVDLPGSGREQVWQHSDVGSQSVWPTVTGGIFESGFSDSILQMWAAFLAERAGLLGDRFGCVTPEEALKTHRIYEAALASHETHSAVLVAE